MSGVYTVQFAYTGSATADLCAVVAASTKPLVILGYDIAQTSDFGDAQEEILQLTIKTGATVAGSGGSAVTPAPVDRSNAAASFTARQADTTKANTGTIVSVWSTGWNVRVPDSRRFTQEEQIVLTAGLRATLDFPTAADSLTVVGQLLVQEIG